MQLGSSIFRFLGLDEMISNKETKGFREKQSLKPSKKARIMQVKNIGKMSGQYICGRY